MRQTAAELVRVAVPWLADYVTVDLTAAALRAEEPSGHSDGGLVRVARGGVTEDPPLRPAGTRLDGTLTGAALISAELAGAPPPGTGLPGGTAPGHQPRLVADLRASEAWRDGPDDARAVLDHGLHSLISTPLQAGGALLGVASFWRARQPGPYQDEELAEAAELAAKAAVAIDNGRRYAGNRATALALQRSLLPRRLDGRPAAEVASRYLPADSRAGVGGDWFDVIPLSGTRVALVVGDVVGHGIQASATRGRLRTAVRTLADVDLPPAELLDHLDDVVARLASDGYPDASDDSAAAGGLGVTCLYAVYDPISRQCTMATAGHPLPLLVTPDGVSELVSDRIGPPLGVGGLPFEAISLDLAEGTILALFTDGLIESRERDIDQGLGELRAALARPAASLEAVGDTVIEAMLDGRPADDAALLLVRTHALAADRVATWDIPADPAMVTKARHLAARQLQAWGLATAEQTTALVVSELVTNAIRHGAPPIQLRLIRDHSLICEVSDASSTAPHLRRSRALDEGGRGLMLVSQLTQGWGARHTLTGKTIWCHQALPPED
jgi:serine phosphatase RsbU (regulator of sigma subunit)/anti-sigma regulatory factor (Ser/Thr protein kinase)